jgi:hypothetical protein
LEVVGENFLNLAYFAQTGYYCKDIRDKWDIKDNNISIKNSAIKIEFLEVPCPLCPHSPYRP